MQVQPLFSTRPVLWAGGLLFSGLLLAGCSDDGTVTAASAATPLAHGNWQISSSDAAAAPLPVFSGALSSGAESSRNTLSGVFHAQSAYGCVPPGTALVLTGSETGDHLVTLAAPLAGGTLTVSGTPAPDGKSLTGASYNVKGGSCAFAHTAAATAQNYAAVSGRYLGTFADREGQVAQVTADFSQSTAPDASGNFSLAGTATVSNNPCFPGTVPVANTQVTGGTFTFSYGTADNSVTATGTFSPDANTLTVSSWTLTGTCGPDTGVQSTMIRQAN